MTLLLVTRLEGCWVCSQDLVEPGLHWVLGLPENHQPVDATEMLQVVCHHDFEWTKWLGLN